MTQRLIALILTLCGCCSQYSYAAPGSEFGLSPDYMRQLVLSHKQLMLTLVQDDEIIDFAQRHFTKQESLQAILHKDKEWPLSRSLRNKITNNPLAKRFHGIIANPTYGVVEIMLTDGFGALLAAYPAPSDYWQGDEPKFTKPVERLGAYISSPEWDHSSQVHSFFIALPIIQQEVLLGVLILGIDVSLNYMMKMRLEDLIELQTQ